MKQRRNIMRAGERRSVGRYAREFGQTVGIGVTGLSIGRAFLPVLLLFGIVGFAFAESHVGHSTHGTMSLGILGLGTAVVDHTANVKVLRQQKVDLKAKGDAILGKVAAEKRALTAEETTEFDAITSQIAALNGTVDRIEAFRDTERKAPHYGEAGRADASEAAKKPFASFGDQLAAVVRAGRGERVDERLLALNAAASGASEGVPADGGYLVQTDFSNDLLTRAYETGIIAKKVHRIPLSALANGVKINAVDESSRVTGSRWGGIQVFWAAEADTVAAKKPKFRRMDLELKKLMGLCYATDELLEDTTALAAVINEAFPQEFGFVLDDAILRGTGAGQPLGIFTSASVVTQTKEAGQAAGTVKAENVVKMLARIPARLMAGAEWYINQEVLPQLPLMTIGNNALFVPPAGGLREDVPYGYLHGRRVNVIEQAEALGTKGDIILANFNEYVMIDKNNIKSDVSMHVRFLNDEQVFRWTYRCDGQPAWNKTLTKYKGADDISPFVVLENR
jgi:HK97 family phage major capsid protein